ncbi:hypothetical protein BDV93DRAFT_515447 [Ceratobasidium sp. AG-I]|nr:hypothetical protein BDV93DRAFT_515447 [Ceratobasidium sp. AG-I]
MVQNAGRPQLEPDQRNQCASCNLVTDASSLKLCLDPNSLIDIGLNMVKNGQVIRTVVPRHFCVLAADLESANPGWRLDISGKICARFITHLFSHLYVSLASSDLGTRSYPVLVVADSPPGTFLDQNHLILTAGNPLWTPRTVIPRHICVLAADLELANPGWRSDISEKMCARFITHLFSRLYASLASSHLGTRSYPVLVVADSPSGTCLDRNHLSTNGNPSRKLLSCFSSAATKKRQCDGIMTTPTNLVSHGFPHVSEIFLDYYCALRFDNQPDYWYLRQLVRDLCSAQGSQGGYASDQGTQGTQRLSDPNDKPIRRTEIINMYPIFLPAALPYSIPPRSLIVVWGYALWCDTTRRRGTSKDGTREKFKRYLLSKPYNKSSAHRLSSPQLDTKLATTQPLRVTPFSTPLLVVMNGITEEELFALALARGWTAPPAASAQPAAPTQPVLSTQSAITAALAATVGAEPSAPAQPALPVWISQPDRRPSAPSRPFAATRPRPLTRPNPTTLPALPAAPAQSAPPLSASLTIPAQSVVSTQPVVPTPSTALAEPAALTRSTAPNWSMGPARVARQAISNSHLTVAKPTGRLARAGAGAPPPRELSTNEVLELHYRLSKVLNNAAPFEIKFVDTDPGGRRTRVNVQRLLGLSSNAFQAIREILKIALERTPGIDLTQTITNQGSNYLIVRAIQYVLPILPGFEVYKEVDYWPLQCIASKLFRNWANGSQTKQRAKAALEAGSEAESNAAPTGEQAIKSEVDPNGEIGAQPTPLESSPTFSLEKSATPGAPTARLIQGAPVVIEDNVVANMTHDLGNMSVDPVREQVFPDEEVPEPFALPADLAGATSTRTPALIQPVSALSTPVHATVQRSIQPDTPPINIAFTATATATSRSVSKATAAVATTVTITPLVAPQTPAVKPPAESLITPGLLERIYKLKDSDLTDTQLNHFPAGARASLLALRNMKPNDIPVNADAVFTASPTQATAFHPPPYQSISDDGTDEASSGLSEPEDSEKGLATDRENMEVDEGEGIVAGGRKGGRGRGRGVQAKKAAQAAGDASGSGRATRSKTQPNAGAGQNKPRQSARQTAAQRASGSVPATSATVNGKKTQVKTTKKK